MPANEPENVVLVPPAMVRNAGPVGPMTTVPPPAVPSASDPITTSTAPLPTVSVAPVLTAKLGRDEELLVIWLLMVSVAPFWTLNE